MLRFELTRTNRTRPTAACHKNKVQEGMDWGGPSEPGGALQPCSAPALCLEAHWSLGPRDACCSRAASSLPATQRAPWPTENSTIAPYVWVGKQARGATAYTPVGRGATRPARQCSAEGRPHASLQCLCPCAATRISQAQSSALQGLISTGRQCSDGHKICMQGIAHQKRVPIARRSIRSAQTGQLSDS
jgi:hypothetical protein